MRIIFMGSPAFAVPTLEALVSEGHDVVAAYCQPPRPAGRGKAERRTAVHERAEALGIQVRTPKSLRVEEEQARFRELGAELAVVAAYGLILPKPILEAPARGCINVHGSLLPRWRGAAPIQRAILAGDKVSGVTIMQMDEGLDTGPMLLKREMPIHGKTAGEVLENMARLGAEALVDWLRDPTPPVQQSEDGVTYAAKIAKAEARIDWTRSAEEIERQVLAFAPSPGAWFEVRAERIKLLSCSRLGCHRGWDNDRAGGIGTIVGDGRGVACRGGYLGLQIVQRAGKSPMQMDEFLRGFPLPSGTPLE